MSCEICSGFKDEIKGLVNSKLAYIQKVGGVVRFVTQSESANGKVTISIFLEKP